MIGLAALCLAGALAIALIVLLIARASGWKRRRIGMLVRPWLLAILILLGIGLIAEAGAGLAGLSSIGWTLAGTWLAVSLLAHLVGRSVSHASPTRLWGGRIAHGGITIALGGLLLSSVFTSTVERSLAPGETFRFNAWTIQLHEVWPAAGEGWAGLSAELRASSGDGVIILQPKQQYWSANVIRSEPARLGNGGGMLTATLGQRDPDGRWSIRLGWTPMLILIPIGLAISVLGQIIAMVGPDILRRRRLRQARLATAWWA